jgi:polysaccharide export outer membrane protein
MWYIRLVTVVLAALIVISGCDDSVQVIKGIPGDGPVLVEDAALGKEARVASLQTLSLEKKAEDYHIGIKDVLNIEVWQKDRPEIQRTVSVRAAGTIDFPLIGTVMVTEQTEPEVADTIRSRIGKYIKDPFVSVRVTSVRSHKAYVFGEVSNPGVFPLAEQLRLLDVVLGAGGVTGNADLTRAVFIRKGQVLPVNFYALLKQGVMANNVWVQHNDKILIPSLSDSKVFVFGEVQKPGVVFLDRQLLLMDAITACEGLTPEAKPAGVRIIRGSLADPTVYVASINKLIDGNMKHNVPLKHGDIVFVPAKGVVHWHRFMSRILPSLTDIYLIREMAIRP